MQSKTVIKWLSFIGGATILAFLTIVISLPAEATIGSAQSASVILRDQADYGLPVRLTIPKIAVDASVEYVGLTPDGSMAVPKGPDDVAWFNRGPRPGENGSAVIAGHFGWKDNIPAVFDKLSTLQKGDQITVTDDKGIVTTFVVRELQTFSENSEASKVFTSSDGKAHLNLVTCEGVWDPVSKSYSKRLVVFADKE